MLSFIKFLFLGLFIGHGAVIIYMMIKKHHLRPRAFIILGCYALISGICFYNTNQNVLTNKKAKLETENEALLKRESSLNNELYREYADVDMEAYIYLSDYYRTELDGMIYHNNQQIEKINKYLD